MRKTLVVFMSAVLSLISVFSFTGCGRESNGPQIDNGKTQLYIGAYDGAFGQGYSDDTVKRFEEAYKDVSFEEGKKGVQVQTEVSQNYEGRKLLGNVKNYNPDVYFVELFDYFDFIDSGEMLEITDLVNSPLNYNFVTKESGTIGETATYKSKMLDGYAEFLNVGTATQEKYYAVPMYEQYYTMIYDVDLFENKKLYFAWTDDDSWKEPNAPFIKFKTDRKAPGPDGVEGTYDDGLPATYDQFYALCNKLADQSNAIPLVYAGQYKGYVDQTLVQAWADYEGPEQIMLNYNFNGVAKNLIEVADDGTITHLPDTTITSANGYLTHAKQAGKYYALDFLYNLITRKSKTSQGYFDTALSGYSHIEAQRMFLRGKYEQNSKAYGILFDGTWWKHEAQSTINQLEVEKQLTDDEMRWGVMPMPKADKSMIGQNQTRLTLGSYAFISSNIAQSKVNVAKAFLQFLVQKESMLEFTKDYDCFLAYDYNLDENSAEYANLSYYAKNLYNVHERDNLFPCSNNNPTFKKVASEISTYDGAWKSIVGGSPLNSPIKELGNASGKHSAIKYFQGLSNVYDKVWDELVG